jgi:hypothetical protein
MSCGDKINIKSWNYESSKVVRNINLGINISRFFFEKNKVKNLIEKNK